MRFGEQPFNISDARNISLYSNRAAVVFGDGIDYLVGALLARGIIDGHGGTLGCEAFGNGSADSFGSSGHQGNFVQ
jgi:hypothetical protein